MISLKESTRDGFFEKISPKNSSIDLRKNSGGAKEYDGFLSAVA